MTVCNEMDYSFENSEEWSQDKQNRVAAVSGLVTEMLQSSLVRPSTAVQHVSLQDRQIALEDMLRKSQKGIPTAKSLRDIKVKVAAMIDEEDRREGDRSDNDPDALRLGLKRKSLLDPSRDKRSRRSVHSDVSAARVEVDIDVRMD